MRFAQGNGRYKGPRDANWTCLDFSQEQTEILSNRVLWEWDADAEFGEAAGQQWLHLLPQKWNPPKAVVYGWRYDPRELSATAAAPVRDERRRGATCAMDE